MTSETPHLNPSKLGTKQYWDQAYTLETQNFTTNPTDEGQVWFSESNAERQILQFLAEAARVPPSASILDVGAGNGHLLFELAEVGGFSGGALVGVDYSEKAVELARGIARERGLAGQVAFYVVDVMTDEFGNAEWVPRGGDAGGGAGFDVCLDKGTFDAISLSDGVVEDGGRRVYEGYAERVVRVMKKGGLLVVTSCNWTEEELMQKMLVAEDLEYYGKISYPSFSFGGKKGQTISSVCFRRKQ